MGGSPKGGESLRLVFPACNEGMWFLRLAWVGCVPVVCVCGGGVQPTPREALSPQHWLQASSWPLHFRGGTYLPVLPLPAFSSTPWVGRSEETQGCSCDLLPMMGGVVQTEC